MTKEQFQKELQEKVKAGVKPSDLKKLKRSKSADDLPTSSTNPSLPRSKSQLEIPTLNQPTLTQQVANLKDELTTERKRVGSLREDLNNSQEKTKQSTKKIKELEDKILELRVDKIKEFGDYLEQKQTLTLELAENIKAGTQEIQKLETKLLTTNKKKLELQSQLGQAHSKNAQLELQLLDHQPTTFNAWPMITILVLSCCLAVWLLKNH